MIGIMIRIEETQENLCELPVKPTIEKESIHQELT